MWYKRSSCNQSCRKDTGVTWNKHLNSAVALGGKQDKISEDGDDKQHRSSSGRMLVTQNLHKSSCWTSLPSDPITRVAIRLD